jgi:hypothetical protein
VVDCLFSKHKVQISLPTTTTKITPDYNKDEWALVIVKLILVYNEDNVSKYERHPT